MLNVEQVVKERLPKLENKPWLYKPPTWLLKNLLHESDIKDFSQRYPNLQGIDFVEQVLAYFNFTYSYRSAEHLHDEGVVIVFPSGEVSRLRPQGVRDTQWQAGFLKLAKATQSDILPIRLEAHNSALFYTASMVYKPLATLLLVK